MAPPLKCPLIPGESREDRKRRQQKEAARRYYERNRAKVIAAAATRQQTADYKAKRKAYDKTRNAKLRAADPAPTPQEIESARVHWTKAILSVTPGRRRLIIHQMKQQATTSPAIKRAMGTESLRYLVKSYT